MLTSCSAVVTDHLLERKTGEASCAPYFQKSPLGHLVAVSRRERELLLEVDTVLTSRFDVDSHENVSSHLTKKISRSYCSTLGVNIQTGIESIAADEEHSVVSTMTSRGPVTCPECGKMIKQARNLGRHYQVCHQATIYPCDFCDSTFNRSDNLRTHIRDKHGIGEKLACPFCSKSFRSRSALDKHMLACKEWKDGVEML